MNTVKHRHKISIFSAFILAAVLISITSCDNSIERIDKEKGLYSIFGILNLKSNVSYFRVKDLTIPLVADTLKELGATVILQDLDRGETEILTDTTVDFDRVLTHNFRSSMNLKENTKYKLTVEGDDGRTVSTTAVTPFIADTTIDFSNPEAQCGQQIAVHFNPVKPNSKLILRVNFISSFNAGKPVFLPITDQDLIRENGKVTYQFIPQQIITDRVGIGRDCSNLLSDVFTISYMHLGQGYDEDISFADSLGIPGGAGSFFGFYQDSIRIKIPNIESLIIPN